jgi:hypothetical protein
MKEMLSIGLLILVAIVGLRIGGSDAASTAGDSVRSDSVSIQIFSAAWEHRPEQYIARRTPIAIVVNGAYRNGSLDKPGLRVVAIRSGKSGSMHNFRFADAEEDIARFTAFCAAAQPGTVLAMGVFRTAAPPEDSNESRSQLAGLFASLGAQRPPTVLPKASWAFICVRTANGWRPIAEAVSSAKGVRLSRVINANALRRSPVAPSLFVDEWNEISLIDRFPQASEVTGGAQYTNVFRPFNGVTGGSLDAIFAHPPYGPLLDTIGHPDNRLAWSDLMIPESSTFRTQLGIESWSRSRSDGVIFQLLVNDELIASKEIGTKPFSPDTWVPWSVDLSSYGGQSVRFELRVLPNANTNSDHALWGDPVIEYRAK